MELGPLAGSKYGIGASWDRASHRGLVDIDLQAVIIDMNGAIIDAVYYNNLKALKAVTHSGDEQTGDKSGMDEIIWVHLQRLPATVKMIVFVVAAFNGGSLQDAPNAMLHILQDKKDNEVTRYDLSGSTGGASAVAMMLRSDAASPWLIRRTSEPPQDGRHFIDLLEPTLGNLIRREVPTAPKRQKVAFAMEKGTVVDLPESSKVGQLSAGLGWDNSSGAEEVDLDVSAVVFSRDGRELGAVFFGNMEDFGLEHSGDNPDGEGSGDDETIAVKMDEIPPEVEQIFFVANVYTNGVTFDQITNPYCRIIDRSGNELAKYMLREAAGERGLIISRLFREPGNRWGFQALGQFCRGKTWKDAVADLRPLVQTPPRDLQMRGLSTMSLGDFPNASMKSSVR